MLKRTAAVLVAAACAVAFAASADAAPSKKRTVARTYSQQQRVAAGPPRARIVVRKRSYLDGGTEVTPGDRKFNDYAFPVGSLSTSPIDPHRSGMIQWNSSSWPPGSFPGF